MTSHYIQQNAEFAWFVDTQSGVNTVPVSGRYHSITGYSRTMGKYLRAQRRVSYNAMTRRYTYTTRLYSAIPNWNPNVGKFNYHVAKCIVKMHNAFDSVQLAKDLAEACTASARFFSRVPASIRYLKKGKFAKAYTALAGTSTARQSLPTSYLQYQWAIRPLISEIQELWEKLNPHDKPVFRISETSGRSDRKSDVLKAYFLDQEVRSYYMQTAKMSVKVVRYFRHDILDTQGFHFNPLGAIWDGIPWSFLVDWFVPVSDVLKGMSYSIPGCVAGFDNLKYELRTEVTGVSPYEVWSPDHLRMVRLEWPETSFREFEFRRSPNTSTSLNAAQVSDLLWSSPAGLTLKRTLNLFTVAWVFASRK